MTSTADDGKPLPGSFYNQRLRAWHPILTPTWVVVSFFVVAVVFIPVGIVLKAASDGVVETVCNYSGGKNSTGCILQHCGQPSGNRSIVNTCNLTMTVTKTMEAPVYVYYELDNFYQNHRRYVKSRDNAQLKGEIQSADDLTGSCDPLVYGDIPGPTGNQRILHPCGLIANSYFNDSFTLTQATKSGSLVSLPWSESGISWEADRSRLFKAVSAADRAKYRSQYQFIDETYPGVASVENEHFIVWMRTAALPNFRKLYARVDKTIEAGTELRFQVAVNFPVSAFSGSKSLVLSTVSFLGGKNDFLGLAYIVVGSLCAAMAIGFGVKELVCPRRPGDVKYLRFPDH